MADYKGIAIVVVGLVGAGIGIYEKLRDGEPIFGPPEPGYRWDDSDGDSGMERGSPPADGTHPRKPGNWHEV